MTKTEVIDLTKLKRSVLQEILNACAIIDAKSKNELGIKDLYKGIETWSVPELNYSSNNTSDEDFKRVVETSTNETSFRRAYAKIYELSQSNTPAPEYEGFDTTGLPSANRPGEEIIGKGAIAKNEANIAKGKEERGLSDQSVRNAIKRQQEIYAEQIQKAKEVKIALENQKVYYKVEKVPVEETQEIKDLRKQAEANPKGFINDAANQYKANPNLKNLQLNEAQVASKQAAVTTYEILTGNSPIVQAAVLNKIASDPKILSNIALNPEHQKILKDFATILGEQKTAQFELGKQFIDFSKIDGYTNSADIKINFSLTPEPDFKEFNLNQNIISPSIENLNQQSLSLGNLTGFGEKQIKSQILSGIGNRLENYVASLPTDSLLARTYSSDIVQFGLSSLGVIKAAPWVAAEGSWLGKIVVGSGFGNAAGFIQAKTGINLGVKLAVEVGTKAAVSTGTKVATGAITGTGLAAGITAAFAWTGPLAPIIGAVGAFLVNVVGAKVISKVVGWVKDNAQKYGKYIVGFVGAGFGFVLGGGSILGAIAGGLVGYGGAAVLSGGISSLGASFTSLGSGIAGFFGALGGAFLGAIGIPIMVTLLVFPVVVALILFIINSGAYIVPSSSVAGAIENPYIGIEKTASPLGPFKNSDLPKKITYTVKITPKKGLLSNIKIEDGCKAISKAGAIDCPSVTLPEPPTTISPSAPYSFNYTTEYDSSKYFDSLITNNITVSAIADNNLESVTGGTSITVGKPPSACLSLDGTWPANYRTMAEEAKTTLSSSFVNYMAKVCSSRETISVVFSQTCPLGWGCYGAWFDDKLWLMPGALDKGQNYTLFTLAHETGHYLQYTTIIGKALFDSYQNTIPFPEICSYGNTNGNYTESFAETIGRFASNQGSDCFGGDFKSKYPANWRFANDNIFK